MAHFLEEYAAIFLHLLWLNLLPQLLAKQYLIKCHLRDLTIVHEICCASMFGARAHRQIPVYFLYYITILMVMASANIINLL